ncbi:13192_t:CDS:2 [Dentiscutata erythropus]|uniref:13192_t:CDS:1 n=1 Tax=Dentiscutata erythropus TaxID=1348616 RepID=A0A9N9C0D6_9GLOM|nr:13192_t:CDS:2 [Dentiscutata erythropus]
MVAKKFHIIDWKEDDIALFKKLLDPFISFIRFYEISRDEFYFYIRPYKKVIPENLYEDLMAYFMVNILNPRISRLPSRNRSIVRIDSIIIKGDNAAIISDWIEKRTTSSFSEKPLYQFILTYRATRDGFFNYNRFINKNSNGAILGLIKVANSEKIIGGYNPLGWKAVNNYNDNYAFNNHGSFGAPSPSGFSFGANNNHAFNNRGPSFAMGAYL